MRSFLNLLEIDTGREIRIAEFGFAASLPSFADGGIVFRRDGSWWKLSPDTGMLSRFSGEIPDVPHSIALRFTSEFKDGIAYCELVSGERVLVRFMGSHDCIGSAPVSSDGKQLVFFGYPAHEFG